MAGYFFAANFMFCGFGSCLRRPGLQYLTPSPKPFRSAGIKFSCQCGEPVISLGHLVPATAFACA